MLEIFSAALGFAAPFLPEVLKYFNRKADNAHELAMLRLQGELADFGAHIESVRQWGRERRAELGCNYDPRQTHPMAHRPHCRSAVDASPYCSGVRANLLGDVAPSFPLSER